MSVLADTLARVVAIREALACGDHGYVSALLEELEDDLAALVAVPSDPRPPAGGPAVRSDRHD